MLAHRANHDRRLTELETWVGYFPLERAAQFAALMLGRFKKPQVHAIFSMSDKECLCPIRCCLFLSRMRHGAVPANPVAVGLVSGGGGSVYFDRLHAQTLATIVQHFLRATRADAAHPERSDLQ